MDSHPCLIRITATGSSVYGSRLTGLAGLDPLMRGESPMQGLSALVNSAGRWEIDKSGCMLCGGIDKSGCMLCGDAHYKAHGKEKLCKASCQVQLGMVRLRGGGGGHFMVCASCRSAASVSVFTIVVLSVDT